MTGRKPSKEELFARGFLTAMKLSPEYAAIIAERIVVPGAKLSPEDAEWLRLVQRGMGMVADALGDPGEAVVGIGMKYKLIPLPPPVASTFEEFAEKYQLELVVIELRRRSEEDMRYRAQFRGVEIKSFAAKCVGYDSAEGFTIHEAVTKYFERISNSTVLIGGEEVFVPKGLRHSSELERGDGW